jgi:hypothetical protein
VLDKLPKLGIAVQWLVLALNSGSIRVCLDLVSDVVCHGARRGWRAEKRE